MVVTVAYYRSARCYVIRVTANDVQKPNKKLGPTNIGLQFNNFSVTLSLTTSK